MNEKDIPIIPFVGETKKWRMWSGKFMAGAIIKVYYVLITDAKKILSDDAEKQKKKEFLHLSYST